MKVRRRKYKTLQQDEWFAFCQADERGDREAMKAVLVVMTDEGNVRQAKRVLYGPTAAQKRESANRQAAVNDDRAANREVAFMMRDRGFLGNSGMNK